MSFLGDFDKDLSPFTDSIFERMQRWNSLPEEKKAEILNWMDDCDGIYSIK